MLEYKDRENRYFYEVTKALLESQNLDRYNNTIKLKAELSGDFNKFILQEIKNLKIANTDSWLFRLWLNGGCLNFNSVGDDFSEIVNKQFNELLAIENKHLERGWLKHLDINKFNEDFINIWIAPFCEIYGKIKTLETLTIKEFSAEQWAIIFYYAFKYEALSAKMKINAIHEFIAKFKVTTTHKSIKNDEIKISNAIKSDTIKTEKLKSVTDFIKGSFNNVVFDAIQYDIINIRDEQDRK